MPILQNIQIAEHEAEVLRENAHKKVEELLEQANRDAHLKAKEILDQANHDVLKQKEETDDLVKDLEAKNLDHINNEKKVLEKFANSNREIGVNYILKQVFEI